MTWQLIYVTKIIMVAVVAVVLSTVLFNYTNKFFLKYDNNNIVITRNVLIIYTILMFGLNVALLMKYGFSISYLFLSFLLLYLSICAFIDYKIQMVYTMLSVIAGILGILFFAYTAYMHQTWEHISLLDAVVFITIMVISKAKALLGGGDWDVFMVTAIYICALPSELFPIMKTLVIMALAIGLQFIANIKNFDFKKGRLKEAVALVPSIFLAVSICLLV